MATAPIAHAAEHQASFAQVAGILRAALVLGPCGGFLFASILTIAAALQRSGGLWWLALAQAHGHLQLYGWAGLFVLGVALHFLPRLRGSPLAWPQLIPWILGAQVSSVIVRSLAQPLAAASPSPFSGTALIFSGLLELAAFGAALMLLGTTLLRGQPFTDRPAFMKVSPLILGAFSALGLATLVNLSNMMQLARSPLGLIPAMGDTLNITLGLFGFLIPIALAMSAQALPMYAGLTAFPQAQIWSFAAIYLSGVLAEVVGIMTSSVGAWSDTISGIGLALMGSGLLAFTLAFIRLMRSRGHIPRTITRLSLAPGKMVRAYQVQIATQRDAFGPFVALVAGAYSWALLAAVLLVIDGLWQALGGSLPLAIDAVRHSLTAGFITLLICGIAPRMLTAFSNSHIRSPALVHATLWLGLVAATLRVGAPLFAPMLASLGYAGDRADALLFGLSGPLGLALAICLVVNLWPTVTSPAISQ